MYDYSITPALTKRMDERPSLFSRLPAEIFSPLASELRDKYWAILNQMYDEFFSPDAVIPEGRGWTKAEVSQCIQRYLIENNLSDTDLPFEGLATASNSARALNFLISKGWLIEEKFGAVIYIVMAPTVLEFFETLRAFAESSPDFVAGRVQTIYNNIKAALEDPVNNAPAFADAAKQCAQLLRLLNNMRLRVRELMDQVRENEDTGSYTQAYFDKFVGTYLSKYYDLVGSNHPLARRWDIIETANHIDADPEKLGLLKSSYVRHFSVTDTVAEQRLEEDLERYFSLRRLDDLMKRLEDAIVLANQQSLAFYRYRLRARGDVESQVDQAITSLVALADAHEENSDTPTVLMGWLSEPLFHEESLKYAAPKKRETRREVSSRKGLTIEQEASRNLRRIMTGHRKVSPIKMMALIERHLSDDTPTIQSNDIKIKGINDMCLMAGLVRVAVVARRTAALPKSMSKAKPLEGFLYGVVLKNYRIEFTGERFTNIYMTAPEVRINLVSKDN